MSAEMNANNLVEIDMNTDENLTDEISSESSVGVEDIIELENEVGIVEENEIIDNSENEQTEGESESDDEEGEDIVPFYENLCEEDQEDLMIMIDEYIEDYLKTEVVITDCP